MKSDNIRGVIAGNAATQIWISLIAFVFTPVYVSLLGISNYGIVGFFTTVRVVLSVMNIGATPVLGREFSRMATGASEHVYLATLLRSTEVFFFTASVLIFAILSLLSGLIIKSWLNIPPTSSVNDYLLPVQLAMAALSIQLLESPLKGVFIGVNRQASMNIILVLMATIRALGAATLLYISPSLISFFAWQVFISLLTVGLLVSGARSAVPGYQRNRKFSAPVLSNLSGFAAGAVAMTLSGVLLSQLDKIVVSKVATLDDLGVYTLATTVASVFFSVANGVGQAYYPRICAVIQQEKFNLVVGEVRAGSIIIAVVTSLGIANLIFFGDAIVDLWLRDKDISSEVSLLLLPIGFGVLFSSINVMNHNLHLAYARPNWVTILNLLSLLGFLGAISVFQGPITKFFVAGVWSTLMMLYLVSNIMVVGLCYMPLRKVCMYNMILAAIVGVIFIYFSAASSLVDFYDINERITSVVVINFVFFAVTLIFINYYKSFRRLFSEYGE